MSGELSAPAMPLNGLWRGKLEPRMPLPFLIDDLDFVDLKQSAQSPIASFARNESADARKGEILHRILKGHASRQEVFAALDGATRRTNEFPPPNWSPEEADPFGVPFFHR
jgi:hypothetical protein